MAANDPLRKRKPSDDEEPKPSPAPDAARNGAAGPSANGEPPHEAPAHAEVIEDLDAYQRRIDREWETAKSVYQNRISEIMNEFLKKSLDDPSEGAAPRPPKEPPRGKPDSMETLVARVAEELRAFDGRARRTAVPLLPGPASPAGRGWKRAGWFAAGCAVAAGLFLYMRRPEWTPLPYAHTGAVAVSGGKIYIADWFRKSLYVHAAKKGAPILAVESLPADLVTGLAVAKDGLWAVDGLSRELSRRAPTPDHQSLEKFSVADGRPTGLMIDKDGIWVGGQEGNKLFRMSPEDPSDVRDRYDLPGTVTALQVWQKRI
ncbi:MAG: hypothetical protein JO102_07940, partial [Elusimicrobia bacterium]|nr:hypothetical protein [Elusimicrobiota bacterium]